MPLAGRKTISILVLGNCVVDECFTGGSFFSGIHKFARSLGIKGIDFSVDRDPGKRIEHLLDTFHLRESGYEVQNQFLAQEVLIPHLFEKDYDLIVTDAWTHAIRSSAFLKNGLCGAADGNENWDLSHLKIFASELDASSIKAAGPMNPSCFSRACERLISETRNGLRSRILMINNTSFVPHMTKPHPPYRNCNQRYCQMIGAASHHELETYLGQYNKALKGISSERVVVLDQERLFIEKGLAGKNCIVHLTEDGFRLLASEILSLLSETFFPDFGPRPPSLSKSNGAVGNLPLTDISRDLIPLSVSDEVFGVSRKLESSFSAVIRKLKKSGYSRVAVFGASASGKVFLFLANQNNFPTVVSLLDNNPKKWNEAFLGVPIVDPQQVRSLEIDALVIASSGGEQEMTRQMTELTGGVQPIFSLFHDF